VAHVCNLDYQRALTPVKYSVTFKSSSLSLQKSRFQKLCDINQIGSAIPKCMA